MIYPKFLILTNILIFDNHEEKTNWFYSARYCNISSNYRFIEPTISYD
jgi:hypothetical protein